MLSQPPLLSAGKHKELKLSALRFPDDRAILLLTLPVARAHVCALFGCVDE